VVVVELDLGHLEPPAPLGLVPQTILERAARVFLSDEELYRFRVVKLGERVQAHHVGPWTPVRWLVVVLLGVAFCVSLVLLFR
jgi:hypothetical protein